jgi:hypothetical protein
MARVLDLPNSHSRMPTLAFLPGACLLATPVAFLVPCHKSPCPGLPHWRASSPSKICREIPYPAAPHCVMSTLGRRVSWPNGITMAKPPPLARSTATRGGFLPQAGLSATLPQVMYADPSLFNVDKHFSGMSLVLRRKGLCNI